MLNRVLVVHTSDAEEVRCELVRGMPDALLHGASSVAGLFSTSPASGSGSSADDAVACLVLEAPEGSFAAAWDDTGDALYAAKWLQEQMPDARSIIMAAQPDQEERAISAVQSVFPGIPVYGSMAVEARNWVTMSHLGSAEHGISLVGIGMQVGFGAAHGAHRSNADFSACLAEVYDAALIAGGLQTANVGILTCSGCPSGSNLTATLRDKLGDIPILGITCVDHKHSIKHGPSIGIMLFGERYAPAQEGFRSGEKSKTTCSTEEDAASVSTAWPQSPATDINSWPQSPATDISSCESEGQ